jgi:hypothetical protein
MTLPHVKWLVDTGQQITTVEGFTIDVWELIHIDDQVTLSKWAEHFRNHYCPDDLLEAMAEVTGLSKTE